MNKVYSIVLLSLAFACVKADEGVKLDQIKAAIKESDLARVKTQWRRIDSLVDSADEKITQLKALIVNASEAVEDSKESVNTAGGGRNYKLVAAGAGLWLVSLGGGICSQLFVLNTATTQAETMKGYALFGCSMGLAYYSGILMRNGWNGGSGEQLTSGGRSKAAIIEAYLEDRLQELLNEVRK